MAVTPLSPYNYEPAARVIRDLGEIGGQYAADRLKRVEDRDTRMFNFATSLADASPEFRNNILRSLEQNAPDVTERLLGKRPADIGVTVDETTATPQGLGAGGVPRVSISTRRDIASGMRETPKAASERLAADQAAASVASTKASTAATLTGTARAEETQTWARNDRLVQDPSDRTKTLNDFVIVDKQGRTRRLTPPERQRIVAGAERGESLFKTLDTLGMQDLHAPGKLEESVLDVASLIADRGVSHEQAMDEAYSFILKGPIDTANLQRTELETLIDLHRAETERSRAALNAKGGYDELKAPEQRLRAKELADARTMGWAIFAGPKFSGVRYGNDGTSTNVNEKNSAFIDAKDARGKPIPGGLPLGFVAALVDPFSVAGGEWMLKHSIKPPLSPDDVMNLRAVWRAFAAETGTRLDSITFNVPDPTPDVFGRIKGVRPQTVTGEDQILGFILPYRSRLASAALQAGENVSWDPTQPGAGATGATGGSTASPGEGASPSSGTSGPMGRPSSMSLSMGTGAPGAPAPPTSPLAAEVNKLIESVSALETEAARRKRVGKPGGEGKSAAGSR